MAKRQNFVVGSTNGNTETLTTTQLNKAWDKFQVLESGVLDGVFNAVSDYSNDSSNEIANAIQSITGAQPTGNSQTELAEALQQMRDEITTTSLTFKGYVATSAPSSSTYSLLEGDLWVNSATMPTSFPIAASSIKEWDGSAWVNYGSTYTPANFDTWRNVNDNNGYYWFGGAWVAMSTDMSTSYFTLNSAGKWEIKSSVNLPGNPTTTTPAANDNTTKIATTAWVTANRANKDLSNLTDTGKNIGTWSTNVTNCVTNIPQDIILELNAGTLKLKAGSKVYVPNGAGVFDTITIESDITSATTISDTNARFLYVKNNGFQTYVAASSGTTPPSTGTNVMFYNTSDNTIKRYTNGSVVEDGYSFPIAIVKADGTHLYGTIDQVFNGFGYIGSTIFVLPGVKALVPNGRNADGTLKNTVLNFTTTTVHTLNYATETSILCFLSSSGILGYGVPDYFEQEQVPTNFTTYATWLNTKENIMYYTSNGGTTWTKRSDVYLGKMAKLANANITSLKPKQVFKAVDYYDFKEADDNNVKLNNSQTITGAKTFTNGVILKTTNMDETVLPSGSAIVRDIYFNDKNNSTLGRFGLRQETDGRHVTEVGTQKTISNVLKKAFMQNVINANNEAYVRYTVDGPTNLSLTKITSATNDDTIPTMGWVNNPDKSTNVVHKSGAEYITGIKYVSTTTSGGSYTCYIYNASYSSGDIYAPFLKFADKDREFARCGGRRTSATNSSFWVQAIDVSNNSNKGIVLECGYNGSRTFTTAITPPTGSNSTDIATTAWVRGKGVLIESQDPDPNNDYKWYRKYSDGWIEQGGLTTLKGSLSITLPQTMADTDYVVMLSGVSMYAGERTINAYADTLTTTTFTFHNSSGTGGFTCNMYWIVKGKAA